MSKKNLNLNNVNFLSTAQQQDIKGGETSQIHLGTTMSTTHTTQAVNTTPGNLVQTVGDNGVVTFSCSNCMGGCSTPCSGSGGQLTLGTLPS